MLRERERRFPCAVPSAGQGHTFYDLTALWLGKTAPRPQRISCSAPVVLFGTAHEGPNMEAGWRPKCGMEPAKHLWSTSRVRPGRRNTSPHPSCNDGANLRDRKTCASGPMNKSLVRSLAQNGGASPANAAAASLQRCARPRYV